MDLNKCLAKAKSVHQHGDEDNEAPNKELHKMKRKKSIENEIFGISEESSSDSDSPSHKKKKWDDSDSDNDNDEDDSNLDEADDVDEAEEDNSSAPAPTMDAVGILPREKKSKARVRYLMNIVCRRDAITQKEWTCKWCKIGDGRICGQTPYNMKKLYAMEQDNRRTMRRAQFVSMIVRQYMETVYTENDIRNEDNKLPELTEEDFELHIILCFEATDMISQMRERIEILKEENESIRHKATKFIMGNGRMVVDNKTYRTVLAIEASIRHYMKLVADLERKEQKERDAEKQRLNAQNARKGKGLYEK